MVHSSCQPCTVALCTCDEMYVLHMQVAAWGRVEAGHDLDEADIGTRVAAPSLFVRLMGGLPSSV